MTDEHDIVRDADAQPASPGATLRAAREAYGMSIDAVAQQLKLAPRQVLALESDDYEKLPGRTFVRGFMRNYARLMRLDPDAVVASLPDAGRAPSLDRPALTPTTRVIGELPADISAKPSSARWAIPLALLAIVVIAVVYEFGRPLAERGRAALAGRGMSQPAPAATAPAATAPIAPPPAAAAPTPAGDAPAAQATPAPVDPPAQAAASGDAPLVFAFRGTSWIEVKDAKGTILLSTMGYPGATQAVNGSFPMEVVLGNAEAVVVSLRGAQFDTTPYVKQNVAKFTVK